MQRKLLIALAFVCSIACGGSSKTSDAAAAPQPARGASRDIITRAEIEESQGVTNAFDLVRRLRPHFFQVQGRTSFGAVPQSPLVRLDGSVLGDVSTLQSVAIGTIEEIRYYSIVEAETKWSGDRGRPVIAVTTRK